MNQKIETKCEKINAEKVNMEQKARQNKRKEERMPGKPG